MTSNRALLFHFLMVRVILEFLTNTFNKTKKLPYFLSLSIVLWNIAIFAALFPTILVWYAVAYDMNILKDDLQFVKQVLTHFNQLRGNKFVM